MIPDLDGALEHLGLNPGDPADAADIETVTAVWSRRTLGLLLGPTEPADVTAYPPLRAVPPAT